MSIQIERDRSVVRITLNNPDRRNALTPEAFAEFRESLADTARSTEDRAVLITGSGSSFCSGADLSGGVPEGSVSHLMSQIHEAARALHRLPQPCVAAVNGPAFGAGMSIALGCDIVVASSEATFCQVFVTRGLVPDFGSSWLLPRVVGLHAAKRLALLGDAIGAEEAKELGIVSEVVPPEQLASAAEAVARRLADGPPIALALTKRLLNASFTTGFDDALDAEATSATAASGTEDVAEAFAAFAAKRAPVFRGR